MDKQLLDYYKRELVYLREMGGEFARENPKIAQRLGLDAIECKDPYVERLLEGFAFLAARVHLKLDAEFPRFTQSLLQAVYPQYLAPVPAMAVVRFQPDLNEGSLAEGFRVPRGTPLRSDIGRGEQTACEFRTAHDVVLLPVRVSEGRYHTQDLGALDLPGGMAAEAAIRIRLECTAGLRFSELRFDDLPVFLSGSGDTPGRLYEQLFAHATGLVVRPASGGRASRRVLPASAIGQVGYEESQALLPYDVRTFQGYRLLKEYFTFPQRFLFVQLAGLGECARRFDATALDVIVLLKKRDAELEKRVDAESFQLFCAPAVNLFDKLCDRIHVSEHKWEFHVVPDRTRPLDFEVCEVKEVVGYGTQQYDRREFLPFYSASDFEPDAAGGGAYYMVSRRPRALSERERRTGPRSSYTGSDVYVSLVDAKSSPYDLDLSQLAVRALCTNRDLPIQMPVGLGTTDFTTEVGGPVESIRCISNARTYPKPSYVQGDLSWRVVSHLALNYLSIIDTDKEVGAAALRDLLRLYGDTANPEVARQIDGVRSVVSRPVMRRLDTPGPIAFARGLEVAVRFDESAFEGMGVFVLGAVLERFLGKYVSVNSFTETVVQSDRGEIMRWPARAGKRQIL